MNNECPKAAWYTENSLTQNANGANVENPYKIHTMDTAKKWGSWWNGFQYFVCLSMFPELQIL